MNNPRLRLAVACLLTAGCLAGVGATAAQGSARPAAGTPSAPNGDILVGFNRDLYLVRADGSQRRRLTWSGGIDQASFSPDGTRVVYSRVVPSRRDLFVMTLDGARVTRLTNTPETDEDYPAWSPDGTRIAFDQTDRHGNGSINIMPARAGAKSTVLRRNGVDEPGCRQALYWPPRWSPSRNELAMARMCGTFTTSIALVRPSGALVKTLPAGDRWLTTLDYDPTGNQIVTANGLSLFRMRRDTGKITMVLPPGPDYRPYVWDPVWSPDGSQIAFDMDEDDWGATDVHVITTGGTRQHIAFETGGKGTASPLDWRPAR